MNRISLLSAAALIALTGCQGPAGPAGADGADGADGAAGPAGAAGANGADGADAPANIGALSPSDVFTGRTRRVTVIGSGTNWSSGATVDFGAGVTVEDVQVASGASIVATISVDHDADLGTRDVTVTDGGTTLTLEGALFLQEPIAVGTFGAAKQGGILLHGAQMLDLTTPFTDAYEITANPGVWATVDSAGLFDASGTIYVDVMAQTGPTDITVLSGDETDPTMSTAQDVLDIAATTPMALADGETVETFAAGLDSLVYTFTAPNQIADITLSFDSANLSTGDEYPIAFLLPASGSFMDTIAVVEPYCSYYSGSCFPESFSWESMSADTYYLVVVSAEGVGAYDVNITMETELGPPLPPAPTAEKGGANDACEDAQVVTGDGDLFQGTLVADDVDWYQFDIAAGQVGQTMYVSLDNVIDTVLTVYGPDACDLEIDREDLYPGSPEVISFEIEDAGSYYVEVSPYSTAVGDYELYVTRYQP